MSCLNFVDWRLGWSLCEVKNFFLDFFLAQTLLKVSNSNKNTSCKILLRYFNAKRLLKPLEIFGTLSTGYAAFFKVIRVLKLAHANNHAASNVIFLNSLQWTSQCSAACICIVYFINQAMQCRHASVIKHHSFFAGNLHWHVILSACSDL